MPPARKARTASFRRDDALARALASTRLEGGTLSTEQQALIAAYQAGDITADDVADQTVTAARTPR